MSSKFIYINQFTKFSGFASLLLILLLSASTIKAQEATLRIQKNIVDRIDRLDIYIRDTIDPEFMKKNQTAWNRIKDLRDSLYSTSNYLREWGDYQDSTLVLVRRQQDQLSEQQRMIDALNWQVKEALRTKGDVQQELGNQKGLNEQLSKENNLLLSKLQVYDDQQNKLTNQLKEQSLMLEKVLQLVKENQRFLKPAQPDSLIQASEQDTTGN